MRRSCIAVTRVAFLFLLPVILCPAQLYAGNRIPDHPATRSGGDAPMFRAGVNLVLVNVTVTDQHSRPLLGLAAEQFQLFQDKQPQHIAYFSSEDVPVSVGVVFDISGSMRNKLERAREAVLDLVRASNPKDEFLLIDVSDGPRFVCDFMDAGRVPDYLRSVRPSGNTALLDSVYLALDQMREARRARRALLLISDGGDNHSRYTAAEVNALAREADVPVYSIGIFDVHGSRPTHEERDGPRVLADLAGASGGRLFAVNSVKDLPKAAAKISEHLHSQYLLGYLPAGEADGKWHRIKVRVVPPTGHAVTHVTARSGYYAPAR